MYTHKTTTTKTQPAVDSSGHQLLVRIWRRKNVDNGTRAGINIYLGVCCATHVMCAGASSSNDAYAAATAGVASPDVFQLLSTPISTPCRRTPRRRSTLPFTLRSGCAPSVGRWRWLWEVQKAAWADAKAKAAGGRPSEPPSSSSRHRRFSKRIALCRRLPRRHPQSSRLLKIARRRTWHGWDRRGQVARKSPPPAIWHQTGFIPIEAQHLRYATWTAFYAWSW